MKTTGILCIVAVMAIPSLAMAELPFSKAGLAQVEATLDFCSHVSPQAAERFKDHGNRLKKSLPSTELEEARKSEEYQKVYEFMVTELGKVAKAEAVRACTSFFEEKK